MTQIPSRSYQSINDLSPDQKIQINNSWAKKLSFKKRQALDIADDIVEYIEQFGLALPKTWKDFQALLGDHWQTEVVNETTGESVVPGDELAQLAKLHYDLKSTGVSLYAKFKQGNKHDAQIMATAYSRHRLDPVWCWRKSQLIRKAYLNYMSETQFHRKNQLIHMTLTVPHKDGIWAGKRFYARELIAKFTLLRKTDAWKKYVVGGEYGVEVKRSPGSHGLHIHIHSMVLQNKAYSVNEARDAIRQEWEMLTGATQFGYESLYYYWKNENGKKATIKTYLTFEPEDFPDFDELVIHKRIKNYCDPDTTLESDYLDAVMECIKYHYKFDDFQNEDGTWDLDLMREVLNNSKNLRMYSRFGCFYGEKALNFNRLENKNIPVVEVPEMEEVPVESQIEALEAEDTDEVVLGSLEGAEERVINPFTGLPAKRDFDYTLCIALPHRIKYGSKNDLKPNTPIITNDDDFFPVKAGLDIKEVMKSVMRKRYTDLFDYTEYESFKGHYSEDMRTGSMKETYRRYLKKVTNTSKRGYHLTKLSSEQATLEIHDDGRLPSGILNSIN